MDDQKRQHTPGGGMLNLTALATAALVEDPFQYAVVADSFVDHGTGEALSEEFPSDGFRYDVREDGSGGRKRYRSHNYELLDFGKPQEAHIQRLPDRWRALLADLRSPEYAAAVAAGTGADLSGTVLDIRLVRYTQDGWIEPHVDRPDKVVTHLFYFNRVWKPEWGGDLRLLYGADLDHYAAHVFPHVGTSVMKVRSDRAWHAVAPVRGTVTRGRKTLIVHFARPA